MCFDERWGVEVGKREYLLDDINVDAEEDMHCPHCRRDCAVGACGWGTEFFDRNWLRRKRRLLLYI